MLHAAVSPALEAMLDELRTQARDCSQRFSSSEADQLTASLVRDLEQTGSREDAAARCRAFRGQHLAQWFHTTHIHGRWLESWNQVESSWHASAARSRLVTGYRQLLSAREPSESRMWHELLLVELAHLVKFLPIMFAHMENVAESSSAKAPPRASELKPSAREEAAGEQLLHPLVDSTGHVVGAYAYDRPQWDLAFVDATMASAQRRTLVPACPIREPLSEPLHLIGHMGHCGSTLLARVLQRRCSRPIIREPRELGSVLASGDPRGCFMYVDVLFSSSPRPAGLKLSSEHLGALLPLRALLAEHYAVPVHLWLLQRSVHEVVVRTLRSNSPTLPDKMWRARAHRRSPGSRADLGLLFAHVESLARHIEALPSDANVTKLVYDNLWEHLALTSDERGAFDRDLKVSEHESATRGITAEELQLERQLANAIASSSDWID